MSDGFDPTVLVAAMYEAFTNGDLDGVGQTLSEKVVWHVLRGAGLEDIILSERETVTRFLDIAGWQAATDDSSFVLGDLQIDAQGSQVIARHSATATIGGIGVTDQVVAVFRIDDELIGEVWHSFENQMPWQGTWLGAGAAAGLGPIYSGQMMGPAAVVAAAYAAVDPWQVGALQLLFDPNIQWHVTLKGGPKTFVGVKDVINFLRWPFRVHKVNDRLSIVNPQINQVSQTEVDASHTLVLGLTTAPTVTDTVTLKITVVNSLMTDAVQTFGDPSKWPF